MQITRQQIIEYLQLNRYVTATELSHELKLTSANIRHHLRLLKSAGLVEVVGQEPVRGRGRPLMIFGLTDSARKNNLDGLASALLNSIDHHEVDATDFLAQAAAQLAGEINISMRIHTRLNMAIERLNQLKYQSSWEASPNGPKVILRNCPYSAILPDHPELCHFDEFLLAQLLNLPVVQCAKLRRSPDGSPHCAFVASGTFENV